MLPTLAVCASFLSPQLARPPAESRAAPQPRCSVALALTLGQQPRSAVELLQLAQQLLALEPTPLAVAQLTDAIDYPRPAAIDDAGGVMPRLADALKRQRRAWLLVALLREDRDKYVETVSFLKIPRDELPNRQGVPLRACDEYAASRDALLVRSAASPRSRALTPRPHWPSPSRPHEYTWPDAVIATV